MTTLRVNKDSIAVLVKPGPYRFCCVLCIGFKFCLDEQAREFLSGIITDKTLISSDGNCYALYHSVQFKNLGGDVDQTCSYIFNLGLGHVMSDQETIVVLELEKPKEDV